MLSLLKLEQGFDGTCNDNDDDFGVFIRTFPKHLISNNEKEFEAFKRFAKKIFTIYAPFNVIDVYIIKDIIAMLWDLKRIALMNDNSSLREKTVCIMDLLIKSLKDFDKVRKLKYANKRYF